MIREFKIRKVRRLIEGAHDTVLKFEGTCCGSNDGGRKITGLFPVTVIYVHSDGCVGIDHIAFFFIQLTDCIRGIFFGCISAFKHGQPFLHLFCDGIDTLFRKVLHQGRGLLRAVSADVIDQALQIAGDQNIHGRRTGQKELAVAVIGTC